MEVLVDIWVGVCVNAAAQGSRRGAVYHILGTKIPGPEDVFDARDTPGSSFINGLNSPNLDESSPNLDRDEYGRILSKKYNLPFIEKLEDLETGFLKKLESIAAEPRQKGKIARDAMKQVLQELAVGHYITVSCLALLVKRDPETLRGQYLGQMVKDAVLAIAFPRTPNNPRQAYTKARRNE